MTFLNDCIIFFLFLSPFSFRHHVEVHDDDWWINKLESYGFRYSSSLTRQIRNVATDERQFGKSHKQDVSTLGPNGKPYNARHLWLHLQVFINPMVASLPQHAHLFSEQGCYKGRKDKDIVHRDCGIQPGLAESVLPESFLPLKLTSEQDETWFRKIQ